MFCIVCGKALSKTQWYHRQLFCSMDCYRKHRLSKGWFTTPNMIKKGNGSVSRSKKGNRKELPDGEDVGSHSISWKGIYNKKQYDEMIKEKKDRFKNISENNLFGDLIG